MSTDINSIKTYLGQDYVNKIINDTTIQYVKLN